MDMLAGRDDLARNFPFACKAPKSVSAINAKDILLADLFSQDKPDGRLGLIWQDSVDDAPGSISCDQDGNLFFGKTRFRCLPATFSSWPAKVARSLESMIMTTFSKSQFSLYATSKDFAHAGDRTSPRRS